MGSQRYSPEFKDEAVRQIVERGYKVIDVAERLGVSAHSLYKWVKTVKPYKAEEDVFDYIEVFYNLKRRHSHLGGISPGAFESTSF